MLFTLLLTHILCSNCKDGFGIDKRKKSETKGQCIPCQSLLCASCDDNAEICTQCTMGKIDNDKNSKTYGKCTTSCSDFRCKECDGEKCLSCAFFNYGVDENGECRKCFQDRCSSCDKNYKVCDKCDMVLGRQIYGVDLDESSETYGQCIRSKVKNCDEVSSMNANECTKCKKGFYLNNNKECSKCQIELCSECSSSTKCTKCTAGYYMKNGECIECPFDNCKECNSDRCYECQNDDYDDSKCSYCNENYGLDLKTYQCVRCKDPNCYSCSKNYEYCYQCNSVDLYVDYASGACVTNCANPRCLSCSRLNNNECERCEDGFGGAKCEKCKEENCVLCSKEAYECEQCAENYCLIYDKFMNLKCVPTTMQNCEKCMSDSCFGCSAGSYFEDDKCVKCKDSNCETCKGIDGICSSCKDDRMPDTLKGSSSYGRCSKNDKSDGSNSSDKKLPQWALIVIIVGCVIIAAVVISVLVYCFACKKKKVAVSESP